MAFEIDESVCARMSDEPTRSAEKWLMVGGDQNQRWRLADDVNLDFLEAQIKAAMRSGDSLTVEVRADGPTTHKRLVLNGGSLPFVVLIEDGDRGPEASA